MTSQTDAPDRAVLLIVGRTRIGKGEFISTANRILHGSELPDIVSRRAVSHTRTTRGYPMRLGNRDVRIVDTVGFDDSSGTDIPERTLLRFLEDTGKADFYPPLVILQTLSALEKDLLEKMQAVFPEVVVAFRINDISDFDEAQDDIDAACQETPLDVFPLQTFLSARFDNGQSRQLYATCVSDILDFYKAIIPSRKNLNLSTPLFAGELERRPYPPETKSEIIEKQTRETRIETRTIKVPKKKKLANGGHEEEAYPTLVSSLNVGSGACQGAAAGCASAAAIPGLAAGMSLAAPPVMLGSAAAFLITGLCMRNTAMSHKRDKKWVEDIVEEIVYEAENKEVAVQYIVTQRIRRTYEREVQEVWKVLAGEIKVFKGYEYGPWMEAGDERLDFFETEVSRPNNCPKDSRQKFAEKKMC